MVKERILMKVILELLRIILMFFLLGTLFSGMLLFFYKSLGVISNQWFGSLAILLLLFKFYRNHWQFSGWVKGYKKLPEKQNNYLSVVIIILLILPLIIASF